jgi:hypothetical protein
MDMGIVSAGALVLYEELPAELREAVEAVYMKDGVPAYNYNFLGLKQTTFAADQPLKPGKASLRFDFACDGGGMGKGGNGTL